MEIVSRRETVYRKRQKVRGLKQFMSEVTRLGLTDKLQEGRFILLEKLGRCVRGLFGWQGFTPKSGTGASAPRSLANLKIGRYKIEDGPRSAAGGPYGYG